MGHLTRQVTATFLVVPLVAAVLGAGHPARLVTLSGAAAILLGADLLLERIGRSTPPHRSLAIGLIGWVAGLVLLGAAGQMDVGPYHGEAAAVVGVTAAAFVGATCSRLTAVLWFLSAAGAVGLGASMVGQPSPGMAMAVSSIAFGAVAGGLLRATLERSPRVPASQ